MLLWSTRDGMRDASALFCGNLYYEHAAGLKAGLVAERMIRRACAMCRVRAVLHVEGLRSRSHALQLGALCSSIALPHSFIPPKRRK